MALGMSQRELQNVIAARQLMAEARQPEGFVHTTCAQKLRHEYIAAQRRLPDFDMKHLQSKFGQPWRDSEEETQGAPQAVHDGSTEEGDDDSDEDDDSDLDDLERAERSVNRLEKKLAKAKVQMELMADTFEEMKTDRQRLAEKCQGLEEKLEEAVQRIDFLEEAEIRWRDKLTRSRRECKEQELYINQIRMNRSDSEASLVVLLERANAHAKLAGSGRQALFKAQRRRDASLDSLEGHLGKKHLGDLLYRVWGAWTALGLVRGSSITAAPSYSEAQQLEIENLQAQLLRQQAARVAVGASMLRHIVHGLKDHPFLRVLLRAWTILHPGIRFERRVEELTSDLKALHEQHQRSVAQIAHLEKVVAKLSLELEESFARHRDTNEELRMTRGDLEAVGHRSEEREDLLVRSFEKQKLQLDMKFSQALLAHSAEMERDRAAYAAEVESLQLSWKMTFDEAQRRHAEVERHLHVDNEELEQQVDALREALKPGGASGRPRPARVVPRSRGVLCAGCLTQILHREVRQLTPSEALEGRMEQQAQEKSTFFAGALGAPDEHDPAHSWMYHRHKDPFGLAVELGPHRSHPDAAVSCQPSSKVEGPTPSISDPRMEEKAVAAAGHQTADCKRPRSAVVAKSAPLLRKAKEADAARPRSAVTSIGATRRPRSGARSRSEALRAEVVGNRAAWQARWA